MHGNGPASVSYNSFFYLAAVRTTTLTKNVHNGLKKNGCIPMHNKLVETHWVHFVSTVYKDPHPLM